jgi:hypothetical protein
LEANKAGKPLGSCNKSRPLTLKVATKKKKQTSAWLRNKIKKIQESHLLALSYLAIADDKM